LLIAGAAVGMGATLQLLLDAKLHKVTQYTWSPKNRLVGTGPNAFLKYSLRKDEIKKKSTFWVSGGKINTQIEKTPNAKSISS